MDELAETRLCGFVLAFHRLAKARAFDFNAVFELHLSGFLLVVVLLLVVAQFRDQPIQTMRKF